MDELFNLSHEYDRMLQQGLDLSGESKEFFLRGRVADMKARLPRGFAPERILDFGCGTGGTTQALAEAFPNAEVTGADTAENALSYAREHVRSANARFATLDGAGTGFDLAYVNGVFHHIEPGKRAAAAKRVFDALKPDGRFAFFENNPWNPGTRMVMARIPFDRDAIPIPPPEGRSLLYAAGFRLEPTRFLFYFPRALAFLRILEPGLVSVPLGAQYHIQAIKE